MHAQFVQFVHGSGYASNRDMPGNNRFAGLCWIAVLPFSDIMEIMRCHHFSLVLFQAHVFPGAYRIDIDLPRMILAVWSCNAQLSANQTVMMRSVVLTLSELIFISAGSGRLRMGAPFTSKYSGRNWHMNLRWSHDYMRMLRFW